MSTSPPNEGLRLLGALGLERLGDVLVSLVKNAVSEALTEQRGDAASTLLDRAGIARVLDIGTSTVDRLRREGMPCILIGDSPRFEAADCIAWLKQRSEHVRSESGG